MDLGQHMNCNRLRSPTRSSLTWKGCAQQALWARHNQRLPREPVGARKEGAGNTAEQSGCRCTGEKPGDLELGTDTSAKRSKAKTSLERRPLPFRPLRRLRGIRAQVHPPVVVECHKI